MPSYYLDTNIWLDIHEQRGSNSDNALTFLRDALTSDAIFVWSTLHTAELKRLDYTLDEQHTLITIIPSSRRRLISVTRHNINTARRLARQRDVPVHDALHAVLAKEHAAIIVTRDRHFLRFSDIVEIRLLDSH